MMARKSLVPILFVGLGFLAYAQDKPQISREPAQYTSPASGADMFSTYCSVCHGPKGKGNGPAASALKKQPADLTQLSKKNGNKYPEFKVAGFIKGDYVLASHGSRDMPIWGQIFRQMDGDLLATARIRNLTEYVATLQDK